MHGMQEKVSIIVVRYGQKFPSLGSRFGSRVMPNRDPRDGNFRPYLTPMKDTYNEIQSISERRIFLGAQVGHFYA